MWGSCWRVVIGLLAREVLASRVLARSGLDGAEVEPGDIMEADLGDLYGSCPTDNAVCVAIRMRNPKASEDCEVNCDTVATSGGNVVAGKDPKFPSGCANCVAVDTRVGGKPATKHWAFDVIYPYDGVTEKAVANGDVFSTMVAPTVEQAFGCAQQGGACKSSAFFAYGASGSGKTFTMGFEPAAKDGVLQLAIDQMFNTLTQLKESASSLGNQGVYMAFYEIYGNNAAGSRVFDLLAKSRTNGEKGSQSQVLTGLKFVKVDSPAAALKTFKKGNHLRRVAGTGMNAVSSRSHAVVQFFISDNDISGVAEKIANGDAKKARLLTMLLESTQIMFVDLAGSEPAAKWEDATRQGEGKVINQGLSSLGQCIAAAADPKKACSTRSDMLTEMLKNLFSKGKDGKAKAFTRMIAAVNPSADPLQIEHTKSTMEYASAVKNIKIAAPKGNKANALVKQLPEQIIAELRAQVGALGSRNGQLTGDLKKCKEEQEAAGGLAETVNVSDVSSNPVAEKIFTKSLKECEVQVEVLGENLQITSANLAAEKETLKVAMEDAQDELQSKEEENDFCTTMLGEKTASELLGKQQLHDFMLKELALLERVEELEEELQTMKEKAASAAASAEAQREESNANQVIGQEARKKLVLLKKRSRACLQLKVLHEVITHLDRDIGVDDLLDQILEIDKQNDKRATMIRTLEKQRTNGNGARVNFMAWLGQKVADLSGETEIGPLQQRLMELDTAIGLLDDAKNQSEMERITFQKTAQVKLEEYQRYFQEQKQAVLQGTLDPSDLLFIQTLDELVSMIQRSLVNLELGHTNVAYELRGINDQAKSTLCFVRQRYLTTAGNSCPEVNQEVASCPLVDGEEATMIDNKGTVFRPAQV